MKVLRIASSILVVLALLVGFGAMGASAAGEAASTPVNAVYIDNLAHPIPANSSVWYRFDYYLGDPNNRPMNSPMVNLNLRNGNQHGTSFDVWAPNQITTWSDSGSKPIGQGTTTTVNCDTGSNNPEGQCQSGNMTWTGAFGASGTYFVRVTNTTVNDSTALLTISGNGVAMNPVSAPVGATSPSTSAQPVASNMDDPAKAVALNGAAKSIPANSNQWFSFNYGFNTDGSRPIQQITLANGAQNGLNFEIYAPEVLTNWWQNDATGAGTPAMVVCGAGMCKSNDLTWAGSFGEAGTYYVRVINTTSNAVNAMLTIQ